MILGMPEGDNGSDFVARQGRGDDRVMPKFRPLGPRAEIARGADWSVMVSRAQGGFLIEHAHSDGGSGRTIGRLPDGGDSSQYVVAIVGTPARRENGVGLVAGLVTANVARVEGQLSDGTSVAAQTEPAPDALGADLRMFVITTPFGHRPFGLGHPLLVHECVLFASDGAFLERLPLARSRD
jgi:hypothetical protein